MLHEKQSSGNCQKETIHGVTKEFEKQPRLQNFKLNVTLTCSIICTKLIILLPSSCTRFHLFTWKKNELFHLESNIEFPKLQSCVWVIKMYNWHDILLVMTFITFGGFLLVIPTIWIDHHLQIHGNIDCLPETFFSSSCKHSMAEGIAGNCQ